MPGTARAATPPAVAAEESASTEATADAATAESGDHPTGATGKPSAGGLPVWALAVVGVLAAISVGLASYLVAQAGQAEAYQESLDRAPAAAEAAAAAVLSYDYESLEADRDAAAKFLSPDYRSQYVDTFDKLVMDTATQAKAKVEAQVLASSAMLGGSERDADRVPVLLFVNQTTTSSTSTGAPPVALNRVRFDMVNVDGTWLVDGITSY
jgi:Mce-associated membrane protein